MSERVSVVGDKLKELQNADLREVAENAKDYARKNPTQAILISAAAGLVLGLILRGSRRHKFLDNVETDATYGCA